MIADVAELCRGTTTLAEQFDLLADLMELEGARRVPDRRLPQGGSADPRDAGARSRSSRSTGKREAAAGDRQDDRGEDRRGRRGRRDPRADQAQGRGAGGGRVVHAAAGPRAEDRAPDLAGARHHDRRRAAGGGRGAGSCAATRASAPGTEEKIAAALAQPQAAEGPRRALLGTTLPKLRAVVEELRDAPGRRSRSRSPARRAACARRSATSTSSRPRPTRRRSSTHFCSLPLGRRRRGARGRRRRRSSRTTACASTCASCRRRATATCSSTSPARRTTTSRCARTRCAAASRSPSTRSPRSRPARSTRSRPRRRSTRFLGYDWIPPELREDGGELAAARNGDAAGARRARRPARRPAHAHDVVGRQGHARGRWSRRRSARGYAYYAICDHSQRLRGDLLQQQSEAIDALNERVAPFRILKGIEVNIRPDGDARRRRRGPRDARLGRRLGALALRPQPDRARARGDGEPVRRLHRAPDGPQDRQARRRRRSTSSG